MARFEVTPPPQHVFSDPLLPSTCSTFTTSPLNLDEFLNGTDPQSRDTDRDRSWDGAEVNELGTDPLNFDTDGDSLPENVKISHISLFDRTVCGIEATDKPIFSVQQHPEASPGPQDSFYLFDRFVAAMEG